MLPHQLALPGCIPRAIVRPGHGTLNGKWLVGLPTGQSRGSAAKIPSANRRKKGHRRENRVSWRRFLPLEEIGGLLDTLHLARMMTIPSLRRVRHDLWKSWPLITFAVRRCRHGTVDPLLLATAPTHVLLVVAAALFLAAKVEEPCHTETGCAKDGEWKFFSGFSKFYDGLFDELLANTLFGRNGYPPLPEAAEAIGKLLGRLGGEDELERFCWKLLGNDNNAIRQAAKNALDTNEPDWPTKCRAHQLVRAFAKVDDP